MLYNAGQLATMIKMACKMDVIDLGDDDEQNTYIFHWMNLFMFQNAKKIRKTATSSTLTISTSDDYVTFLLNGQPITDMYEPYQLLDINDKAVSKRTSFDDTRAGWYREDAYSPIHVRGLDGDYRLKYIRYPTIITLPEQYPELMPAAYHEMITWVSAQIKLTKNFYAESEAVLNMSRSVQQAAVKASMNGMGTNAQKPGPDDAVLG